MTERHPRTLMGQDAIQKVTERHPDGGLFTKDAICCRDAFSKKPFQL